MPPKCLVQFVCPSPKNWGFRKEALWMSLVRGYMEEMASSEAQANSDSTIGEFPMAI